MDDQERIADLEAEVARLKQVMADMESTHRRSQTAEKLQKRSGGPVQRDRG
jgi:hypothetical protein